MTKRTNVQRRWPLNRGKGFLKVHSRIIVIRVVSALGQFVLGHFSTFWGVGLFSLKVVGHFGRMSFQPEN